MLGRRSHWNTSQFAHRGQDDLRVDREHIGHSWEDHVGTGAGSLWEDLLTCEDSHFGLSV